MKRKELQALRGKSVEDLTTLLNEKKRELLDLRFSQATGSLENTARVGQVKREIAKILTVISQLQIASRKNAAATSKEGVVA